MPATFGYIKKFLTRFQGNGECDAELYRQRLGAPPSRLDIIAAFRLILGREPENTSVVDEHLTVATLADLRRELISSQEFRAKFRTMHQDVDRHPSLNRDRPTVAFIHLQKTGGTSLREMLAEQFPVDRRCPVFEDKLHILSLAELGHYDFFAGHFDVSSVGFIPRDEIATVAMFREPRARLISYYRFLRSHPAAPELAGDALIPSAHTLTAEQFFEQPELRTSSATNNHYLCAFGRSFGWFDQHRESLDSNALSTLVKLAKSQICALTALGITERFSDSARLIYKTLGIAPPDSMRSLHVTDDFALVDSRFRRVESVQMSPRLAEAMKDLVVYDEALYACAVNEFERRLHQTTISVPSKV